MSDPIAIFASKLVLTPKALALRTTIFERQLRVAHALWPHTQLITVGSFRLQTALHRSNIDGILSSPTGRYPSTADWAAELNQANLAFTPRLYGPRMLARTDARPTPAGPLVTLQYTFSSAREGEVPVALGFRDPAPAFGRDSWLRAQLRRTPGAADALVVLKALLARRGLARTQDGGLGSYEIGRASCRERV